MTRLLSIPSFGCSEVTRLKPRSLFRRGDGPESHELISAALSTGLSSQAEEDSQNNHAANGSNAASILVKAGVQSLGGTLLLFGVECCNRNLRSSWCSREESSSPQRTYPSSAALLKDQVRERKKPKR